MEMILIASIFVNFAAFALAMRLLYKTRDWRLSFLAVMAVLVAVDLWGDLKVDGAIFTARIAEFRLSEFTDVVVSVAVLLSVFFVGQLIETERRRTEELRAGEARYRSLFDDTPVMLHSEDLKGRLIDVNRHWLKVMGYRREEVLGTATMDFLTEASRRLVENVTLPAFIRTGRINEAPLSLTTKEGETAEVILSSLAERDEHGAFVSSRTVMIDVTLQRAAERAQRKSEKSAAEAQALLLEAMESSPDGIAIYDSDDRLKLYNKAFKTGALSGIADLVEPGVRYEELLRAALTRGVVVVPQGDEEAFVRARLEHRCLSESTIEVELANGRWMLAGDRRLPGGGIVGTRGDITDRKRAELALREGEARLRAIIENVPGVVFQRILHADGRVTFPFLSSQYAAALGIDPDAAMKYPQIIFGRLHPDDLDGWLAAWRKSAKSRAPFDREVRISRSSSDMRWFRVRAVPRRLPDGDTLWDAIGLDVTDEKRASEVRDRMFAAMENLSEGVALFGPDDRLVYTNPRYVEFNERGGSVVKPGKTFEQIVRRNVRLGRVPEAAGREEDWIAERLAAHRNPPYTAERLVGRRWFDIREAALPDGSTVLLNIDISERRRAHAALAESEARLRLISDSLPVGIVYLDTDLRYRFANKAYCAWQGIDPDEIIGKNTTDVLGAKATKITTPSTRAALAGEYLNFETRVPYKVAGVRDVQIIAVPHADDSGKIVGAYGLILDITERKRADEARRASESRASAAHEQLMDAVECISEGFVFYDADQRLILCNSTYRDMFPQIAGMLVPGARLVDVARAAYERGSVVQAVGKVNKWLRKRLRHARTGRGTLEYQLRDGRWVISREKRTSRGGVVGIRADITELKEANSALHESEQRTRKILENIADGVITIDERGKIQTFNQAAERMFGYAADEIVGRAVSQLMPAPDRKRHPGYIRDYLETGKGKIIGVGRREVTARRKDGTTFPASLAVSETRIGGKRNFIGSLLDLTQQETANQALRARDERLHQIQSELLRVNRAATIGELSSSLSHELKQPLAAATFYMQAIRQLLKKDSARTGEEIVEIIGKVGDQVARAAGVVGRLRPLLERGDVERKEADINAVVEDAVAVAALELDRKNIDLKTILGRHLPPVPVDRIQVQQILLNLVRNGVEATRDSKRRELTVRTRATKDGEIEVSVGDSGCGIPAKLRETMFEPFVTSRVGGTGMGLSVSRTIVEAHGGRIWASRRRGGGTIMHFTLGLAAREPGRSTPSMKK